MALILILIGLLNAPLAGAGVDECCGVAGMAEASGTVDESSDDHDCSDASQASCAGCGFLGHCSVALVVVAVQVPRLHTRAPFAYVASFHPEAEPVSFLDPPIA